MRITIRGWEIITLGFLISIIPTLLIGIFLYLPLLWMIYAEFLCWTISGFIYAYRADHPNIDDIADCFNNNLIE